MIVSMTSNWCNDGHAYRKHSNSDIIDNFVIDKVLKCIPFS